MSHDQDRNQNLNPTTDTIPKIIDYLYDLAKFPRDLQVQSGRF